ncbi:hypothetical protein BXZ70DRAFT_1008849 [Cristinia sonorae]|uniref:DUF6534 domain-containing protein n=1 Tax=Cristinia sonorae TaxID=1940300 RepID=A0A8K0XPR4_9AGAR|nr:hypothetical protein BXZ70DRAFT_1008849 [Cristinia sonorae]
MGDVGDVRDTLGATLIGAFLSAGLSGILSLQVIFYFRIYSLDFSRNRIMVGVLWVLDLLHIAMTCSATWTYLIANRTNDAISDYIPWTIAVTVALTAIITFIVHCFFAQRVYNLGGRNLWLTSPIVILAFGRLFAALVSTSEMIRLRSYAAFVDQFGWVFTVGLSLSVAVDVLITVSLLAILRRSRTGYGTTTDHIIDTIALYTVETGMITSVTTVVSLWVCMPHNLIFLALHFTISKLYANSALATLNTRNALRKRTRQPGELPTIHSRNINTYRSNPMHMHMKTVLNPSGRYIGTDIIPSEEDAIGQLKAVHPPCHYSVPYNRHSIA